MLDLNRIDSYRKKYLTNEKNLQPIEKVLEIWAHEKAELRKIFGDELVLKKDYTFTNYDYLEECIKKEPAIKNFVNNYDAWLYDSNFYPTHTNRLNKLITASTLARNVYDGYDFVIILPNGKKLMIAHGCKVARVLGKIAKAYNIAGFEEARLAHSRILNCGKAIGKLCISIDPYDFMVASNPDNSWTSCLNWRDGCHKQGSVEMMNSPNVVVAYLEGKNAHRRWREFFVVDPLILSEIKSYPYRDENLTQEVLKWLRELVPMTYNDELTTICGRESPDWRIEMECGLMYNDFGAYYDKGGHYCYLSEEVKDGKGDFQYVYYSGPAQCMECGRRLNDSEYDPDWYAGSLTCPECAGAEFCQICGRLDSDCKTYNGRIYCADCYNELIGIDYVTREPYPYSDMTQVFIVPNPTLPVERVIHYPFVWIYNLKDFGYETYNVEYYKATNSGNFPFNLKLAQEIEKCQKNKYYWSDQLKYDA